MFFFITFFYVYSQLYILHLYYTCMYKNAYFLYCTCIFFYTKNNRKMWLWPYLPEVKPHFPEICPKKDFNLQKRILIRILKWIRIWIFKINRIWVESKSFVNFKKEDLSRIQIFVFLWFFGFLHFWLFLDFYLHFYYFQDKKFQFFFL